MRPELLPALRRLIFFANQGEIRPRQPDVQGECLTLITNAVIAWHTVYIAYAIDQIHRAGAHVTIATSLDSHRPATDHQLLRHIRLHRPKATIHRPLPVELDHPISSTEWRYPVPGRLGSAVIDEAPA